MAFVVFDTETTGLPRQYIDATPSNYRNWDSCRIVQIAWEIYDSIDSTTPLTIGCYVVSPDGFTIPAKSTSIHGISTEEAIAKGTPIADIIELFISNLTKYDVKTVVAHNIAFDSNVLLAEMHRMGDSQAHNLKIWKSLSKHCTMETGTIRGGRWPTLKKLYTSLIGPIKETFKLHRADVDTQLCAAIYKVQVSN